MAEQYDNNNRGAAFTPYPEQKLFLQGKLQIDYKDHQIALITNETRDGKTAIDVYGKLGRLFLNENPKEFIVLGLNNIHFSSDQQQQQQQQQEQQEMANKRLYALYMALSKAIGGSKRLISAKQFRNATLGVLKESDDGDKRIAIFVNTNDDTKLAKSVERMGLIPSTNDNFVENWSRMS